MNIGDKDRVIVAEAIARSWQDNEYRKQLLSDPARVLKEAGMAIPAGVKVTAAESTADITYAVLPEADFETFKPLLLVTLEKALPLNPGHEVRVVQNSANQLYIVLPQAPEGMASGKLSDAELAGVAGGGSAYLVEGVAVATSANVAAEANAAAVLNVAGATEAAAAAVTVAVVAGAVVLT